MFLRSEGISRESGRSGKSRQLSEEVWQQRKGAGEPGRVERWFWNGGSWARCILRRIQGEARERNQWSRASKEEGGGIRAQEELPSTAAWPMRAILTRISQCWPQDHVSQEGHLDCLQLLSGAFLGNMSLGCVDSAIPGGHLWASGNTSLTAS